MIDIKELRINNQVKSRCHKGLVTDIYAIFPDNIKLSANPLATYSTSDIDPIELTAEWLTKFGFTLSSSKSELWSYGNTMLIWRTEYESDELDNYYEFRFGITSSYGAYRQVRLDYVHQLQNLTYILTGEELLN